MLPRFMIGIEEEFQMVDRHAGQLSPRIQTIMEKGHAFFGKLIKPEMLQSTWKSTRISGKISQPLVKRCGT